MDHDQRFKTLIMTFFEEFMELFFKQWAERLDVSKVEWLTQEIFAEPPEGPRRVLDLVAKLPTRKLVPGIQPGEEDHWMALVHIEIESPESSVTVQAGMFDAYVMLRRRYRLPVLPIALYLKVGLDGIGKAVYEEHFWELTPVRFEFLYVGLPGLDAIEYVEGHNWLGVALAALMKVSKDRIVWLGAEALRRIQQASLTDQRKFLLGDCVQAYLPLDDTQQNEFEKLLAGQPYEGVKAMNLTSYDKGMAKGIEKGVEQGIEKERRDSLRELLEERFGALSPRVLDKVDQLSMEQLRLTRKALARECTLRELGLEE